MRPITTMMAALFLLAGPVSPASAASSKATAQASTSEEQKFKPHKKKKKGKAYGKKGKKHNGKAYGKKGKKHYGKAYGKKGKKHYGKPHHKHVVKHRRRRAAPHRGRRVVVASHGHHTTRVIHHEERRTRRVVERRTRHAEDNMIGLGVRIGTLSLAGDKLNLVDGENNSQWGLGLQLRGKIGRYLGVELAADYVARAGKNLDQTTIPITLSLMPYLNPNGKLKVYGILGGGVHFTNLQYEAKVSDYDEWLVELEGHLGLGAELRLSPNFGITADARLIGLYKNLGERDELMTSCGAAGGSKSACSGIRTADDFDWGGQFTVGASLYF